MPHRNRSTIRWAGLIVVLTLVPTIASAQAGDHPGAQLAGHPVAGSLRTDGRPTAFESARYADHVMTVRLEVAIAEAKLRSALALRAPRAAPPVIVATHAAASTRSTAGYSGPLHADWYAIAQCESSGNWAINTGNGFWGGLQFTPSTWFAYGGGPFDGVGPFPYSASAQIAVGERVLASQGPGAWPYCFRSG